MSQAIDFYFDFSSPYGYIASTKIDAIAAKYGRQVLWRPFLLGVAFKTTGMTPLPQIPVKGAYHLRDFPRSAKYHGVEFRHPTKFPIATVAPARAFYWLDSRDPERAKRLAAALYRAYFFNDIDISEPQNTIDVGISIGLDGSAMSAGMADASVKERTRSEVERAISCGAFGSPYIIIDGEPFWGADRLDQIDRWLATGGW